MEEAQLDFKVTSTTIDGTGVLLVSVQGELDIATAKELATRTAAAVSDRCPLVLDLAQCSFIDSRGLWSVLQVRRELSEVGQEMVLVIDPHSQVSEMLAHICPRPKRLRQPRRGNCLV
jgi:anti-anti-sigma factor